MTFMDRATNRYNDKVARLYARAVRCLPGVSVRKMPDADGKPVCCIVAWAPRYSRAAGRWYLAYAYRSFYIPTVRKVGVLTFVRIGRLSFSYCICKPR